jgi:hypothetical protein
MIYFIGFFTGFIVATVFWYIRPILLDLLKDSKSADKGSE